MALNLTKLELGQVPRSVRSHLVALQRVIQRDCPDWYGVQLTFDNVQGEVMPYAHVMSERPIDGVEPEHSGD